MPSVDNPNAPPEAVNGLYKTELLHQRGHWRTIEQVELAALEHVWWWNNSRLHGELNMRTPLEVEHAYYADLDSAQPALAGQSSPGNKRSPARMRGFEPDPEEAGVVSLG